MAEMASIAPTAGGQYHWVSEFAPETFQKPLSFIVGWSCCLGWIAGIPACAQILAGLVQGMVILVYPDADVLRLWQTALMIFAVLVLAFAFNLYLAKYLPLAEGVVLVLHVVGFLAFLIVMWAITDHVDAKKVFTEFEDGGGWGNMGLSVLVGIGSPLWFFIGPDAGAHMSEELKDASLNLPRAMMWSMFFNGIMGILTLITFCFCIPDVSKVIDTPTEQPVLQVIYNITGSYAAACVLGSVLAVLTFFGTVTNIAAASRQTWAFARDHGFPFSKRIMKVHSRKQQPLNALYLCAVVSFVLAAINFGSYVAFDAIISVSNAALIFSYLISVTCLRVKRLRNGHIPPHRWSLGRFGGVINDIAIAFLLLSFVLSFFPETPLNGDPEWAQDFNWSIIMFIGTCFLALVYYWWGGRQKYVPPVRLVKND
ncbi:amino acid transporter [Polychaeton citri CBS 116435]|uniref:Amino acid transporter n=1 Tax=Polychaeton citri CBS 116435 TaxID=1314669 RepID=A0A9P4UIA8_9PEZI|nr:amino acid transporter [Polychaeton citri CBS 116435]